MSALPMSDRIMRAAPRDLGGLFQGICDLPSVLAPVPVTRLVVDSRDVQPGDVFVALGGGSRHGLEFMEQAVERGAAAVLYDEVGSGEFTAEAVPAAWVEDLRRRLPEIARRLSGAATDSLWTIGITGTDGKTSVSYFIAQAMNDRNTRMGMLGTLGNGYPDALRPSLHTTPDVLSLHREMARFASEGASGVVMEVSSHALDQERVAGLAFDVAVLTQLGRDHLDYHGSPEAYAAAKRKLFYWPGLHWRVINADDPFGRSLLARPLSDTSDLAYGLNPMLVRGAADHVLFATAIHPHHQGMEVAFDGTWGRGLLRTPLLGRFNVANLLAALAVLLIHGEALKPALRCVETVRSAPGRMETFGGDGKPTVVVDYAHTAGALQAAIEAIRSHANARLVTVFGCGGDRDQGKRPLMGDVVTRLCDAAWLTDDNPRFENPDQIVADILDGVAAENRSKLHIERDRACAIAQAISTAQPDDIVLVAGKGHEEIQIVGEQRVPFSDAACVMRALSEYAQ